MKKKPIQLEWQGNILDTYEEKPVILKNKNKINEIKKDLLPQKIEGKACLRIEKKGRAGNPVAILYKFSSPLALNNDNLKHLCSELKTKLACGGTCENNEIILMIRDIEKLKNVLQTNFNIFI